MKTIKRLCLFVVFVLFSVVAVSFSNSGIAEVRASENMLLPDDGIVISEDDPCCDCCHKHQHTGEVLDRYLCFACKIMTFLKQYCNIPAEDEGAHRYILVDSTDATCVSEGERNYVCGVCDKEVHFIDEKTAHTPMIIEGKKATCYKSGLSDGEICLFCKKMLKFRAFIPALGHDVVTDSYVSPTCTKTGLTRGEHCGRCDEILITQEPIPATGHDFSDGDTVTNLRVYKTGTDKLTADIICYSCKEKFTDFSIDAAASVGGYNKVYHTLEKAVSSAKNQNVYLLRDYTLRENINIANGVTLVIPAFVGDTGQLSRSDDGFYSRYCADNYTQVINKHSFRVLTVPKGRTINVQSSGTLFVSAITGLFGGGNPKSYGVSDGYGQISLGGTINVGNGGTFDCSGYVTDDGGEVNLEKGARMFETYGILYWRGGSYAAAAKGADIFPIDGYEMNYMRAKLNVSAGALLLGSCKMCAGSLTDLQSSQYYYCHFKLLGDGDGYVYQLQNGARVERTVAENGRVLIKFFGDVRFGSSSITVGLTSFKTSTFQAYKTDGNYTYEFYDGTVTCKQKCQFMPGAQVVVGKGATVNITDSGAFIFCTAKDYSTPGYYYYDSRYEGALYPANRDDAKLIVKDGGKVNVSGKKAILAGMVYISSDSSVNFADSAGKTAVLKVAVGPVDGVSVFAKVTTENYTVPYIENRLS